MNVTEIFTIYCKCVIQTILNLDFVRILVQSCPDPSPSNFGIGSGQFWTWIRTVLDLDPDSFGLRSGQFWTWIQTILDLDPENF